MAAKNNSIKNNVAIKLPKIVQMLWVMFEKLILDQLNLGLDHK